MRASGLWRALEHARRANLAATGEPAPVAGEPGHTRRQVILALAAAAALPRELRAAPSPPAGPGPVAIIGGGIAGLTALWTLTRAGVDARLYEARPRLGGRMFTARLADGELVEMAVSSSTPTITTWPSWRARSASG